jgi:hypothetical protein
MNATIMLAAIVSIFCASASADELKLGARAEASSETSRLVHDNPQNTYRY